MTDETLQQQAGNEAGSDPGSDNAQSQSGYRDVIAERLAQRRSSQPQQPAEQLDLEPELRPQAPIRNMPPVPGFEPPQEELKPEIELLTESMEIGEALPVSATPATGQEQPMSNRREREQRRREEQRLRREERRGGRPQQPEGEATAEPRPEEQPEQAPLLERSERPERTERPERADRPERAARPERSERPERAERPERSERPERVARPERSERPERTERPERSERPERRDGGRPEKPRQDQRPPQQQQRDSKPQQGGSPLQRAKALASKLGVSVVIPLYNEQDSLRELHAALKEELFRLCEKKYEIIFINDGSTDRSTDILRDIVAGTSRVTTMHFRRNMGKSPALAVGFREAKYGIVITMDADLQDDPKELVNLIAKLDEGYDLVTGWKKKRNDPMSKTAPSKLFNRVTSFFAGIKLHDFNCGLKAYRKEVTDSLDVYGELHRYLPALAYWKGFKIAEIPVVHHPRRFGKSKFGTSRFFKGFLDLLSIVFTNRYGKRPLHLFGTVGTLIALIGVVINVYVTIEWFQGIALSNRPILLLGILLILVGVQLVSLGLLGEMIVKNSGKTLEVGAIRDKRARSDRPDRPDRSNRPERSDRPDRGRRREKPAA